MSTDKVGDSRHAQLKPAPVRVMPPRGIRVREDHLQENFDISQSDRDCLKRIMSPPPGCPDVSLYALRELARHRRQSR